MCNVTIELIKEKQIDSCSLSARVSCTAEKPKTHRLITACRPHCMHDLDMIVSWLQHFDFHCCTGGSDDAIYLYTYIIYICAYKKKNLLVWTRLCSKQFELALDWGIPESLESFKRFQTILMLFDRHDSALLIFHQMYLLESAPRRKCSAMPNLRFTAEPLRILFHGFVFINQGEKIKNKIKNGFYFYVSENHDSLREVNLRILTSPSEEARQVSGLFCRTFW